MHMSIISKIKKFFTVKRKQKFVVGVFLNGSFNIFDYKKNLLEKVKKSNDIMSAKKNKKSGIFSRDFAKLIIAKKLQKAGLSYEDAKSNTQHLFVHFAQQIIQLKKDCTPKQNIVGFVESDEYPTNYCSNFGQIDFYITVKKGGEMSWTMDATEFGFPAERDVEIAKDLSREQFEDSIEGFKQTIENCLKEIKNGYVEKDPASIRKENEKMHAVRQSIGEMGNTDVIEKALIETEMPHLDEAGVIKALHDDNKIKQAALQTA